MFLEIHFEPHIFRQTVRIGGKKKKPIGNIKKKTKQLVIRVVGYKKKDGHDEGGKKTHTPSS